MANRINLQKALTQYHEEMAWCKEMEADPLFDCWDKVAEWYEPDIAEKFMVDEPISTAEGIVLDQDFCTHRFFEEFFDICFSDPDPVVERKAQHRLRRKATAYHKRKLRRTAIIIYDNYFKRAHEDMQNGRVCKKRGGRKVLRPKSLTKKSDDFVWRVRKQKLLTLEAA